MVRNWSARQGRDAPSRGFAITSAERDALGVEAGLSAGLTITDNLDASLAYDIRLRYGHATNMGVLSLVASW